MKLLKKKLKKMSWENGNVFERVEILRNKVKEYQAEVDKFPHDGKIEEKSWSVLKDYQEAIQEEYSLLCQKAKVEWLKEGDINTAYIHKTIKERVHRGRIMTIRNEEGDRFVNEDVATQIVKHFEVFLGQSKEVQSLAKRQNIFINKRIQKHQDYTARFYKSACSIVGKEICQAIKEFFLNGKLLGEVNATLISLVPKIHVPDRVSDFRPIACCNVLYKCISKILTSRIKGVFGKLVGENQSAFTEGRQITDNILLSQELFKGYNRKQHTKKVSFKIDLQKAYDTISWSFLKEILEMFGFHKIMVKWIMTCITSTKFSINVNGERVGYFKGGRGLRQGDPISPYLFTLVMEVLNLLIQKNIEESKGFKYHFGCKKLKITHLCFADDLLIFCHGDLESVKIMKKSLDEFSGVSGLLPNMHKSTIFFGGLSSAEQHSIINIIPFSVGKLPIRYLGVPLLTKKLSISDCKPLISKVKTKVNDWKNKALSYAGRVQLIAFVLSSMQNYWASVFLLPKQVIYEINKILKGFLWCQGELTKRKAKISWDKICKPKDQGGLGLKDLGVWNEVLMTKHLWNVAVKKNTLWVKWIYMEKLKDKSMEEYSQCAVSLLSDFIETRDIYDARLSKNYSINDIINEGRWKWPEEWNTKFVELNQIQIPTLNEDIEDTAVWVSENEVWHELQNLLNVRLSDSWNQIISEMEALPLNRNIWSIVRRITFNAAVYFIWQERNNRIFKNEKRDKETIVKLIKENTVMKLIGLKVKESITVNEVENKWKIKLQKV
ncbi:RNA-directed DNA polymerase, eukaryota, reverse transcriptase zinc-binding domain protein [Tanacetum coccineum]|uniref:RNA-directed DNA polymerase, eukaryota, reverse transcriptase zinc-binding domain protein n=1 Tax=Tanacetum coccineum TaxID=301880 RepID=A0ABQ5ABS1_9ASTR